jgi:membrane-bound serine protease (ClpP class)
LTAIVLLFGLGLLLILAEVLVPSFGLLGGAATLCILGAIGWGYSLDGALGTQLLVAAVVLVPVFLVFGLKLFPKSFVGRRFTATGFSFEDGRGTDRRDDALLGVVGTLATGCRPAGIAMLAGRRVDVVSRGEPLEAGTPVVVVEVSGNRVVVARATTPAPAPPTPST